MAYDYGDDITYNSEPDYDSIIPFDSQWGCFDWRLWYEELEDEYGDVEAKQKWEDAWAKQGTLYGNEGDCKLNKEWKEWADSKNLQYDHTALHQLDSWLYGLTQGVGDAATGVVGGVGFLGRNLKLIIVGIGIFGGLYVYKEYIKGDKKL
tara:strand:+ start:5758 stop:6207 length:450 start_codon:yes stop_codon:yes gene_type:complete